jgi:hypothetical protein
MFWSILTVAALCLLQLAQAQMKASSCDVDSSMELFLEPFARRVNELNMFAQGAKGFLIEYPGSPEVLRISCAHGADNTRRGTDCVFTCDLAPHLQALQFEPAADSNMHIVLAKSIELYKVNNKQLMDTISLSVLGDEHAFGVLPGSVANNVFGVNSPMYRQHWQICIDALNNQTAIDNKKIGSTCAFQPPLRFVVEVSRRFAGSLVDLGLAHAEGRIKLTASDLLYFGFGYFHDDREMLVHHNWFPTDAHPGNILYNMTLGGRPSCYWNDLGRTSSDGRLDGQIRASMKQFIDFVRKCMDYELSPDELPESDHTQVSVSKQDVNRVLSHMRLPHANESYLDCFSAVLRAMHDEIMSSFTQEFRTMLWLRIGSSSRVVVSDMNVRLADLKTTVTELKEKVSGLNEKVSGLEAARILDQKLVSELEAARILDQKLVSELNEKVSEIKAAFRFQELFSVNLQQQISQVKSQAAANRDRKSEL